MSNLFTQIQTPTIPISLFGDATNAGIAAGKNLPTQTTAAIEGFLGGYERGQQIQGRQLTNEALAQQNVIRQNQIEQLPVANQIQQETLENNQIVNEINRIKLDLDTKKKDEALQAELAKLREEQSKANDATRKREELNNYYQQFNSAPTPLEKRQVFIDNMGSQSLAEHPETFAQHLAVVRPYLTPDQQQQADSLLTKYGAAANYRKDQVKYQRSMYEGSNELADDYYAGRAAATSGLDFEAIAPDIEVTPAGAFEVDPKTNQKVIDDTTGEVKQGTITSTSENDWYYKGTRIASNVPKESQKKLDKWLSGYHGLNGSTYKHDVTQLSEAAGVNETPEATATPVTPQAPTAPSGVEDQSLQMSRPTTSKTTVVDSTKQPYTIKESAISVIPNMSTRTEEGLVNVSENEKFYKVAQTALNVPDEEFLDLKSKVQSIFQLAETDPDGWFGRYTSEQRAEMEKDIGEISTYVAGRRFDTGTKSGGKPLLTYQDVTNHNKEVDKALSAIDATRRGTYSDYTDISAISDYNMLVKVNTPKELYVLQQSGKIRKMLTNMFNMTVDKLKKDKLTPGVHSTTSSKMSEIIGSPNAAQ